MLNDLQRIRELIGELASKITEIDYAWYMIFTRLMPQTPLEIIDALMSHRANTGEAQRQLILAIASIAFSPGAASIKFLGKANKITTDIVRRRNDAIHSVIFFGGISEPRIHAFAVAKRSALGGKDIILELTRCLHDAEEILRELYSFGGALPEPEWPPLAPIRISIGWKSQLLDTD